MNKVFLAKWNSSNDELNVCTCTTCGFKGHQDIIIIFHDDAIAIFVNVTKLDAVLRKGAAASDGSHLVDDLVNKLFKGDSEEDCKRVSILSENDHHLHHIVVAARRKFGGLCRASS